MVSQIVEAIVSVSNGLFSGLGQGITTFVKYLILDYTVDSSTGVVTWTENLSVFAGFAIALGAVVGVMALVRGFIGWVRGRSGSVAA